MKKRLLLLFLILCSLSFKSDAQGEANFWYFGHNAGLDFNSGSPVVQTNGAIMTDEGSATISTAAGALRFYTDGMTVWNNQHNPMPNGTGLFGNASSTQSAVIVPKPGSANIYYVFTVDAMGGPNGLRYSEVDMSLAGGLGNVTATKNIALATPVTEKVTAVKNANNIDIWVIAHDFTTNKFYVYSVTSAGVNTVPIISNAGSIDAVPYGIGNLKASADGSKLVQCIYTNTVDILNFNNASGTITNDFTFSCPFQYPYGAEFSPDGSRLYFGGTVNQDVYQYNMAAGSSAAIISSMTVVGSSTTSGYLGAFQMAPDGKIYIAKDGTATLGCINNPNTLGIGCGFVDNAVNLLSGVCKLGLPNFIQTYFNSTTINYVNTCLGDSTHFSLANSTGINSVLWDFNDPASGVLDSSTLFLPSHVFTNIGTYNVTAITHTGSIYDTLHVIVSITGTPVINIGNDTSLCAGASIVLNPGAGYLSYLWQNFSTPQTFTASAAGTYYVKVTSNCGTGSDTIHIGVLPPPVINLGNDTSLCSGNTIVLDAGAGFLNYSWQNLSANQTFTVSTAGTYYVDVTSCGTTTDTIHITALPSPLVNVNDTSICIGQTAKLIANGAATYSWSAGATAAGINTATVTPAITSTYTVTGTMGGCTSTDISIVTVNPYPVADFTMSPSGIIKPNTSVSFTDGSTIGSSLLWNFDDPLSGLDNTSILSFPSHEYATEGIYCVTLIATNSGKCSDTTSNCITVEPDKIIIPNVFTPNGDGNNDFFVVKNLQLGKAPIKIYNRWGKIVFESTGYNNDWNGKNVNDGVYYYILENPKDEKTYTGFVQVFSK
jgi:gliding motility-associated-like protein